MTTGSEARLHAGASISGSAPARSRPGRPTARSDRPDGALTTDFDPDLALDDVELPDIDANAAYARVLQHQRGDLFRERLDEIDMAAADDETGSRR